MKNASSTGDGNFFVEKVVPETESSGLLKTSLYAQIIQENSSLEHWSWLKYTRNDVLQNTSSTNYLGEATEVVFKNLDVHYNTTYAFLLPAFYHAKDKGFSMQDIGDPLYYVLDFIDASIIGLFQTGGTTNITLSSLVITQFPDPRTNQLVNAVNSTFSASIDYVDTYSFYDEYYGYSAHDLHFTGHIKLSFLAIYDYNFINLLEYDVVREIQLNAHTVTTSGYASLAQNDLVFDGALAYYYKDASSYVTTFSTLDPNTPKPGVDPNYPYFSAYDTLYFSTPVSVGSSAIDYYTYKITVTDKETGVPYYTYSLDLLEFYNRSLNLTLAYTSDKYEGVFAAEEFYSHLLTGTESEKYKDINGTEYQANYGEGVFSPLSNDTFYYRRTFGYNSSFPLIYYLPNSQNLYDFEFDHFLPFGFYQYLALATNTSLDLVRSTTDIEEENGILTLGNTTYIFPAIWQMKRFDRTWAFNITDVPPRIGGSEQNLSLSFYVESYITCRYHNITKMLVDFGIARTLYFQMNGEFEYYPVLSDTPRNVTFDLFLEQHNSKFYVLNMAPGLLDLINPPPQNQTTSSTFTSTLSTTSTQPIPSTTSTFVPSTTTLPTTSTLPIPSSNQSLTQVTTPSNTSATQLKLDLISPPAILVAMIFSVHLLRKRK